MLTRLMPGFIGIGAMRAGTSWLSARLSRHPELWIGRKEIHFFDRKMDRRLIPFLDTNTEARLRYGARFLPGTLRGRLSGEFTPRYAVLEPDRIARVRALLPDVRLLFIVRDPAERAWSQLRHDFPRWRGIRAEDAAREDLLAFFDAPRVRKRGDYASCLENWLRFYPREQLFLTFLEDVARDPGGVLRDTFAFLGVDAGAFPPHADLGAPVHAAGGGPLPEWARAHLEAMFRSSDDRLEALVGRRLPWRDRARQAARPW